LTVNKSPGELSPLNENGDLRLDTAATNPGIQAGRHSAATETNPSIEGTSPAAAATVASDSPEGTNPSIAVTAARGLAARTPCPVTAPLIEAVSARTQHPSAVAAIVDPPSNAAVASEESSQLADEATGDSILVVVEDFK